MGATRWVGAKHPRDPLGRFSIVRGLQDSGDSDEIHTRYQEGGFLDQERELNLRERSLAYSYVAGSDGYNGGLRGHRRKRSRTLTTDESDPVYGEVEDYTWDEQIELLDSAVEAQTLADDTRVYRGFDPVDAGLMLQPGVQLTDPGYLSTTVNPSVSEGFGDHVLEIEVPAGTAALPASKYNSNFSGQDELVLPRGAIIEILDQREEKRRYETITHYRARLVGFVED